MPVRRINYTQRQKIHRNDIDIAIRRNQSDQLLLDATLRLDSYGFPADARVSVEAYRQTTLMRFDFGTVSIPSLPTNTQLSDFDSDAEIRFRVRVTARSGRPGVLLGEADRIVPQEPGQEPDKRVPLLRPVPGDIGEEIWRIEFEGEPLLRISSALPDWKATARSESFRAFVYPTVLREILYRILIGERYTATDDMEDWRSRWLLFATSIPGAGAIPRGSEDYDDWIENSVSAFARRFGFRTRYETESLETRS